MTILYGVWAMVAGVACLAGFAMAIPLPKVDRVRVPVRENLN